MGIKIPADFEVKNQTGFVFPEKTSQEFVADFIKLSPFLLQFVADSIKPDT